MFDTIVGLPAHPLFVHAAVVLLPLAALATVIVAWRPDWWPRLGLPIAVVDFVVLGATWVAKESGEKLEHRLPKSAAIHEHAELGDVLPLLAGVLFLCSLLPAFLAWRTRRTPSGAPGDAATSATRAPVAGRGLTLATAVVTTLVSLGVLFLTFRVGHTGAQAVWTNLPTR